MNDKTICAEFILSAGNWETICEVIKGLQSRGFESYEVGRGRILISASTSQYQERLDISFKLEGDRYVPAAEIKVPDDLKPYVQSISFSSSLTFFDKHRKS